MISFWLDYCLSRVRVILVLRIDDNVRDSLWRLSSRSRGGLSDGSESQDSRDDGECGDLHLGRMLEVVLERGSWKCSRMLRYLVNWLARMSVEGWSKLTSL